MSLLDIHEQELDTASRDLVARPMPTPAPVTKFNGWRMTTAAPKGVAAGAAESSGFFADVLGAFGQVAGATPDARGGGMFSLPTEKEQREQDEARTKLITDGPNYSSEAGDLFRGVARGYRPDPQSAHVAESLVFDASRIISKAVGYSIAGGPLTGAALTGADEGMTVADDLRLQGVDLETRTKAGAVQGAGVALGVALPVAGKTLGSTIGLVAAGGPGAFVAQQAATRQILQQAGYAEIGQVFDPFDPVGLTVATLLPAGFGAFALRRARASTLTAPDAAPAADTGNPATLRVDPETVDAARVALAAEQAETTRLTSPADLPARAAEDTAIARAEEQLAAGEPVRVEEVGALDQQRLQAAGDTMLEPLRPAVPADDVNMARLAPEVRDVLADRYARAQRDKPAFDAELQNLADELGATVKLAALKATDRAVAKIESDYGGDASRIKDLLRATIQVDSLEQAQAAIVSLERRFNVMEAGKRNLLDAAVESLDGYRDAKFNVLMNGHVAEIQVNLPQMLKAKKQAHKLYAQRDRLLREAKARGDEVVPPEVTRLNEQMRAIYDAAWSEATSLRNLSSETGAPLRMAESGSKGRSVGLSQASESPGGTPAPIDTGMPSTSKSMAPGGKTAGRSSTGEADFMATSGDSVTGMATKRAAAEAAARHPDLQVQIDGMEGPMRAEDLLAGVKAQADEDVANAPLLAMAAECAITG